MPTVYINGKNLATTFVGLTDAPNTYAGSAGDSVIVNAGETGLTFGPGSVSYYVGVWNSGYAYSANDMVNYSGTIYKSLTTNTNSQPDTNPSDWLLYPDDVYSVVNYASSVTLTTTTAFRKIHRMVSASSATFNLPGAVTADIGEWLYIAKRGTGNLGIASNGTETMSGDMRLQNIDSTQTWAGIKLVVEANRRWGIYQPLGSWGTIST